MGGISINIITILEYIGIAAFSASGAYIAIKEKLDLFGIYIIALVTAVGGGVFRDIVTNAGIPAFFSDYTLIPFIFIPATIVILLRGKFRFIGVFTFVDAVGLAAFVVSSGLKAINHQYNFMLFLFVTLITGVGGGIFRDILINKKPVVFRRDVYATAGLFGAVCLWLLYPLMHHTIAAYISISLIIAIRMICYVKSVNLPVIRQIEKSPHS